MVTPEFVKELTSNEINWVLIDGYLVTVRFPGKVGGDYLVDNAQAVATLAHLTFTAAYPDAD